MAERHERPVAPAVLLEVAFGVSHLPWRDLGVVGVDRWEMGQHTCAIDTLPPERRMWEEVLLVPTQLLSDEPRTPALFEDLRQRRRVAEHVRDPNDRTAHPEPRLEVALPEHQLAHDALATWKVHVGLDPHAADGMPLAAGNLVADVFEDGRVAAFDPVVLGSLRAGEVIVGVVVHQPDGRGERARTFALRLANRPQPGGVDVGVTDSDDSVRAGPCTKVERRLERPADSVS